MSIKLIFAAVLIILPVVSANAVQPGNRSLGSDDTRRQNRDTGNRNRETEPKKETTRSEQHGQGGDRYNHQPADEADKYVFGIFRRDDLPGVISVLFSTIAVLGVVGTLIIQERNLRHIISVGSGRISIRRAIARRDSLSRVTGIDIVLRNSGGAYVTNISINGYLGSVIANDLVPSGGAICELGSGDTALIKLTFVKPRSYCKPMISPINLEVEYFDHRGAKQLMSRRLKAVIANDRERLIIV